MARRWSLVVVLSLVVGLLPTSAIGAEPRGGSPGSPGAGDPYFPRDGNGGYDIKHYDLAVRYAPSTDQLVGVATITALATQGLTRFNLDFEGLTVRSIEVDGSAATWDRAASELRITPASPLSPLETFTTVIRYDGVPQTAPDGSGFIHTQDGALVIGQPHVAATWFPANDHPSDRTPYTLHITAPTGLQVISNGRLAEKVGAGVGWTEWTWVAREAMASYLVGLAIGEYATRSYQDEGIRYIDAVDKALFEPPAEPRTGERMAISGRGDLAYKRLARTFDVPATGGKLSFWITRDTEPEWDFVFVEAHTIGANDWTTLRDLNGHTSRNTGRSCPFWHQMHPFLRHYQSPDPESESCAARGTTGAWHAASGASDGWEHWRVDLAAYAGKRVRVAISYATDDIFSLNGAFLDDITGPGGQGSTSFEHDGDILDGWEVTGAPAGSPKNENDWFVGMVGNAPPALGHVIERSLERQPEIIRFLSNRFGPYPFTAAGAIVHDVDLGFALENQTRPIYSTVFWEFGGQLGGDSVVVHELAHQWFGDSLAVKRWSHIWLNEGFATYAEWLWSEREGLGTAQQIFDQFMTIPADEPFWDLAIGDPGPDRIFDGAVYFRGAMTLHALRLRVGDTAFFEIVRRWAREQAGRVVTTTEFQNLAELVSGRDLDRFFERWLFGDSRPGTPSATSRATTGLAGIRRLPTAWSQLQRLAREGKAVPFLD